MKPHFRWFDDFVSLFYPRLCLACGNELPPLRDTICLSCQYHLPKTNFHHLPENPFTDRFWGRIPLRAGAALYHFNKNSRTQRLIHHLKYDYKPTVGIRLGQLYGKQLMESEQFRSVDLIVPVPLHPRKEKIRGYNQSAVFAKGLSQVMQIPWRKNVLARKTMTTTQTQKSRMERFQNVQNAFVLQESNLIRNKHILLVDDVLTTGATLEACAICLLNAPGTTVSMVTIGIAGN